MLQPSHRRWIATALWIGVLAAGFWLWLRASHRIELRPRESAPAASPLRLVRLDGSAFDLASLEGQVVLVNLWASWCGPCRAEMPRLIRLDRDFRRRGLVVLGLNVDAMPPSRLARVRDDWGITFPVVVAGQDRAGTTFEGRGVVPHTWMIDRQGRVRASHAGWISEDSLRSASESLLSEPTSDAGPDGPGAGPDQLRGADQR